MHFGTYSFPFNLMIVHPGSTSAVGLLAAVKAPVRRPDGTRNIKFTVAAFRPWRVSPASIASDPTFNAALRFAYPRHRLPGEFSPARADCWCKEPLPPRLARPNLSKKLEPWLRKPSERPTPKVLTLSELLYHCTYNLAEIARCKPGSFLPSRPVLPFSRRLKSRIPATQLISQATSGRSCRPDLLHAADTAAANGWSNQYSTARFVRNTAHIQPHS